MYARGGPRSSREVGGAGERPGGRDLSPSVRPARAREALALDHTARAACGVTAPRAGVSVRSFVSVAAVDAPLQARRGSGRRRSRCHGPRGRPLTLRVQRRTALPVARMAVDDGRPVHLSSVCSGGRGVAIAGVEADGRFWLWRLAPPTPPPG